jgi:cbb3-type cytochrome oxidase cytochrome c subunit
MGLRSLALGSTLLMILLGGTALTAGIPASEPATLSPGWDLYQRLSCRGCHSLQGRGSDLGPVLDRVGGRLSREELETQLLTPRRRQADSLMPSFAYVRPCELQALVDFLQKVE